MVLGIISIIAGGIIGIINFFQETPAVTQQTVQYLGFVCASIFIVGGLLIIAIKNGVKNLEYSISMLENKQSNFANSAINTYAVNPPPINKTSGPIWICNKCKTENSSSQNSCKGCGAYK